MLLSKHIKCELSPNPPTQPVSEVTYINCSQNEKKKKKISSSNKGRETDFIAPLLIWASTESWIILIVSCIPPIKPVIERLLRAVHIISRETVHQAHSGGQHTRTESGTVHLHHPQCARYKNNNDMQIHYEDDECPCMMDLMSGYGGYGYGYGYGRGKSRMKSDTWNIDTLDGMSLDDLDLSDDELARRNIGSSNSGEGVGVDGGGGGMDGKNDKMTTTNKLKNDGDRGVTVTTDIQVVEQSCPRLQEEENESERERDRVLGLGVPNSYASNCDANERVFGWIV